MEVSDRSKSEVSIHSVFSQETIDVPVNTPKTLKSSMNQSKKEHKSKHKPCIIYPKNQYKRNWDLFISILLIIACFITPIAIVFDLSAVHWVVINATIDILFFVDMVITFLSAYVTDEFVVVEDHASIAKDYLTSWFLIDLLAIVPFDLMIPKAPEGD